MKKLFSILAACLVAIVCYAVTWRVTDHSLVIAASSTNTIILDCTLTSAMGLQISFIGQAQNSVVETVALTNLVTGAAQNSYVSNVFSGTTNVFYFTNAPAPNVLTYTLTNTTTFATTAGGTNYVGDSHVNPIAFTNYIGTNLFTVIITNVLTSHNGTADDTTTTLTTNTLAVTNVAGLNIYTLSASNTFTVTNPNSTNTMTVTEINVITFTNAPTLQYSYIQSSSSAATSATNLYSAMTNVYPNLMSVAYANSTNLTVTSLVSNTITGSVSAASLGTVAIVNNAIAGGLVFTCSNSTDKVTWFNDTGHTFTISYNVNSGTRIDFYTNFTGLGTVGYYQYTIKNAAGNYAGCPFFDLQKSVKEGL